MQKSRWICTIHIVCFVLVVCFAVVVVINVTIVAIIVIVVVWQRVEGEIVEWGKLEGIEIVA